MSIIGMLLQAIVLLVISFAFADTLHDALNQDEAAPASLPSNILQALSANGDYQLPQSPHIKGSVPPAFYENYPSYSIQSDLRLSDAQVLSDGPNNRAQTLYPIYDNSILLLPRPQGRVKVTAITPFGTTSFNEKGQVTGSSPGSYYTGPYTPSTGGYYQGQYYYPQQSSSSEQKPSSSGSSTGNQGFNSKPQNSGNYQQTQQQPQPQNSQQQQQTIQKPQQQQPQKPQQQQKPPVNLSSGGFYQGYYRPPTPDNPGGYFTGYFWPEGSNQGIYYNGYVPPLKPTASKPVSVESQVGNFTGNKPANENKPGFIESSTQQEITVPPPDGGIPPILNPEQPPTTNTPPTGGPWWLTGVGFGQTLSTNPTTETTVPQPESTTTTTSVPPPNTTNMTGPSQWSGGHGTGGPATVLATKPPPVTSNKPPASSLTVFGGSVSNQNIRGLSNGFLNQYNNKIEALKREGIRTAPEPVFTSIARSTRQYR